MHLPFSCCRSTSAKGNSVVTGIQLGNVWVGVQVRPGHGCLLLTAGACI
jgi:hypothetical protein